MNLNKTVNDIMTIDTRGPWKSKSGGELNVLFALPQDEVTAFLDYDHPDFDFVQQETGINMRGIRVYNVSEIPKNSIGGLEWHGIRTELVSALGGKALWQCADVFGNEQEFVLDGKKSVLMPPGIMHTYVGLEDDTRLQVVCNTLFDPDNPLTHDSYSKETFVALQEAQAASTIADVN
jgi:dTDP-4-dehydrorhamnose 3,5-epimerase-like enzyme